MTGRSWPVPTADDMRALGERVGRICRGGDVVVLAGDLGAGKTTFTQGLAAGLDIEERVTSPTFVIARVHERPHGDTGLIHVDAYRLGSAVELDDLDIDADLAANVVVVEWGSGIADHLSTDRLLVTIVRSDREGDESRTVHIEAYGEGWRRRLAAVVAAGTP